MARLIYSTIASLDGYVTDAGGNFQWAAPDEEVHTFVNALEEPIATYLYGRRMYEVMAVWQTPEALGEPSPVTDDYARVWQNADKIVFSTTLDDVWTPRTELVRTFEPDEIAALKARSDRDLTIGGPTLAAHAIRAGLVDELQFFVVPMIVGSGTRALPDGARTRLELVEERRFASGFVFLRYTVRP